MVNKIGIYQLVIVVKYYDILFYVVCLIIIFDLYFEMGKDIYIEERFYEEMIYFNGVLVVVLGMDDFFLILVI